MRRLLPLTLAALAGCATHPPADVSMQALRGQPAQVAFSYLGLPDAEQRIAGTKVYVWSERGIGTRLASRPFMRPSHVDAWFWWEPDWVEVPYSYACTLRLFVDERDVVTGGDVRGHGGGCGDYSRQLAGLTAPR